MKKVKKRPDKRMDKKSYKSFILLSVLSVVFVLMLIGIVIAGDYYDMMKGVETVATIDGRDITNKEFQAVFDVLKIDTVNYFKEKHNATLTSDADWKKTYDGENPLTRARNDTMEQIKKNCEIFKLGKENKLITIDYSYKSLYKEMKRLGEANKNTNNASPYDSGVSYTDFTKFYPQYVTELSSVLMSKLGQNELKPTDADLKAYYESKKDTSFKKKDIVNAKVIKVAKKEADDTKTDTSKIASDIKTKLESGTEPEAVVKSYDSEKTVSVTLETKQFDDASEVQSAKDSALANLSAVVQDVEKGKVSATVALDDKFTYAVAKVLDKKSNGVKGYDEVKSQVSSLVVSQKFDEKLKGLAEKLKVKNNQSKLDKIK
jgi:hypothetical protein